ncbi:hypothetical protein MFLAVUS_010201 [Mucor flavus]|uniref:C2 domain-containing protein n=1 Tax=Mucor flavus TaxID=439312 RepID=A0ABP9ZC17_9FUNG
MFGKQSARQASAKEFDLDELLDSTLKDVDDDLDMNDPDLLKQLQELSSSTPKPKPKPLPKKPQVQAMEIDIDSYAALAQGDDDIHVDLDENDFSDPRLLNELSSLSSGTHHQPNQNVSELINMGFSQDRAVKALDMFDNDLERAANYLFDSPTDMDTATEDHNQTEQEKEEESSDPYYWQEKALEYKKLALAAKRSGDKSNAVALLRESKVYNQKYQDLLEIQPIQQSQPVINTTPPPPSPRDPTPPPRETTPPPREITPPPREPTPHPPTPPPQPTAQDLKQVQEVLGKVITLQKQYKEAALHYKGLGNLSAAKQMVRTSKVLLHTGIKLKNGEITDLRQVKLPDAPDMTLGDGKIRQVSEATSGVGINSYQQIESQLTYQINICHNLSIQNAISGQKKGSSKILSDSQDNYAKVEHAFSTDLVSLRSYQSNNQNIPSLHYEQVNYTYKNILDNIPDNMMEFKIIRAISLPTLDISVNLDPFATWDFGGWPPENTAQAAMNKGETPVVSGANPQYDFSIMIPISRTNRLFTRYVQRKKLTVEVFHNKYTYGLFRRPVSLGKIVLPMDRLLTKASISGIFDLLDSSRKKTGGKIEIQVNLREPLTGEDIVKRSERWLVLDSFGSTASQCMALAGLTVDGPYTNTNTPQLESLSAANSPVVNSPVPQEEAAEKSPEPVASTPLKSTVNSSDTKAIDTEEINELKLAEEEFNSVDNIVSNMVMEHELGLVNAGLAGKQPAKSKEDLMDRKQALEIKMNMLVIQVQTGMLDMNTYLENVQKRLESDRRLAIVFKKHQRLDLARASLVRKKIMQDELDEARAAMAAQEDE